MKPKTPKPRFKSAKQYVLFNKPYAVLCQFSPEGEKQTLKDFLSLPKDIYPVGRLDYESEGLLLLTNDTDIKTSSPIQNSAIQKPTWRKLSAFPPKNRWKNCGGGW